MRRTARLKISIDRNDDIEVEGQVTVISTSSVGLDLKGPR